MPTPTIEMLRRSHAKAWLMEFARPSVLVDLYQSMSDCPLEQRMIQDVHVRLTGEEIPNAQ